MNGYLLDRKRGGHTRYRIIIYRLGETVGDASRYRIDAAEARRRYRRDEQAARRDVKQPFRTPHRAQNAFYRTRAARCPAWITAAAWSSIHVLHGVTDAESFLKLRKTQ